MEARPRSLVRPAAIARPATLVRPPPRDDSAGSNQAGCVPFLLCPASMPPKRVPRKTLLQRSDTSAPEWFQRWIEPVVTRLETRLEVVDGQANHLDEAITAIHPEWADVCISQVRHLEQRTRENVNNTQRIPRNTMAGIEERTREIQVVGDDTLL